MEVPFVRVKQEKPDKDFGATKSQTSATASLPPGMSSSSAFATPPTAASTNTQQANVHAIFEKRILELAKDFPKGITDKILQNDMPGISDAERALAINKLLMTGRIDLYRIGNELLYKVRSTTAPEEPEAIRGADNEEKVVFDIVKEAGNMGIWIRDIRVRSNLTMPQVNKLTKALENKKLIKAVKSVTASKKKVYMLYGLEPHRSLTGGAWYSDQDFESEFVTVLNQQCYKYLVSKRDKARSHPREFGPKARMAILLTTLDEVWKFISKLGISKVELTTEDIQSILNTLIYDGKIQKMLKGDETFYMAVEPMLETTGLMQSPCGVCPVAKDCSEGGVINPGACTYLGGWMQEDNEVPELCNSVMF